MLFQVLEDVSVGLHIKIAFLQAICSNTPETHSMSPNIKPAATGKTPVFPALMHTAWSILWYACSLSNAILKQIQAA